MICGTIHRTLGNKTEKDTEIKFYKAVATYILAYGSGTWTMTRNDDRRIQTNETKFLRKTKVGFLEIK